MLPIRSSCRFLLSACLLYGEHIILWAAQERTAVLAGISVHGTLQTGTRCISGLLQQPQDQGKTEGLAACNSQTTSPFGCLNNFYFKILSNFSGSLQKAGADFSYLRFFLPFPCDNCGLAFPRWLMGLFRYLYFLSPLMIETNSSFVSAS